MNRILTATILTGTASIILVRYYIDLRLFMFINSLKESDRGKELDFLRPEHEEDKIKKEHTIFIQ